MQTTRRSDIPSVLGLAIAIGLAGCDESATGPGAVPPTPSSERTDDGATGTPGTIEIVDIWTPAAVGDASVLRTRLAAEGVNPNDLDPTFGVSGLAIAADFGQAESVRILLDAGADPNTLNRNRSSPALGAAFFGRPECLRILLDAGADPSIADENGTTTFTALNAPWEITRMIAEALQMPLDPELLAAGRDECRRILAER